MHLIGYTLRTNLACSWLASAALLMMMTLAAPHTAHAQVCPFDDGNSTLAVDGLILTRYALGITGAPLVANTDISAVDAPVVEAHINCPSCGLNITGNPTLTVADATIISRKLAGFSGAALTDGLNLGSGTRNTPVSVNSFLLAGCGATGGSVTSVATGAGLTGGPISTTGTINLAATQLLPTTACAPTQIAKWNGSAWLCAADATVANAFVQGGNAFGAPGVIGTTDVQPLTVRAGGGAVRVLNANFEGLRVEEGAPNAFRRSPNVINGSILNVVAAGVEGATIAGGGSIDLSGGTAYNSPNTVSGNFGTIGGGISNTASGGISTISGGQSNTSAGGYSTIGGGGANTATQSYATVGGGSFNSATGEYATVSGGRSNLASGANASVLGGIANTAAGKSSVAIGTRAKANYDGAFLWADSTDLDFKVQGNEFSGAGPGWPSAVDTFNARATGGVWFVTAVHATSGRPTAGAFLSSGSGTWASTSDRAAKTAITPVDAQAILRKVAALPISSWQYLTEKGVRHIGPMAQDFKRLFAVGPDERSITTIDADGVALAAIQGLNQIVQAKDAKIAALEKRLTAMEKRLGIR